MDARASALVPGTPNTPPLPLVRYQTSHLTGVYQAFVESVTQAGEVVLAIGASTGAPVAEAVRAGRRALALYRNPIELLRAQIGLATYAADGVQAALTQLGDLPKSGRPLMAHITSLYASRCPACNTVGIAQWFAWDRDAGRPYAKRVECRRCGAAQEGPVDNQDLAAAGTFPLRGGPAYHLALSRAASIEDGTPERIAELVQLYTLRSLAALMDILYRLPQLHLSPDLSRVIYALILETFDRCSSLTSATTPDERPRSLRLPQRFVEYNVWSTLEQALSAYGRTVSPSSLILSEPLPSPATSLAALLATSVPGYVLLGQSVHDLAVENVGSRIGALLWEIHPPDATYWAQSVLWASWLWGDALPAGLRGFMRRRRLDWDWYRRSMVGALQTLRPLMREGAPLLVVVPAQNTSALRTVMVAVRDVGLTVDRFIACPPVGYRLLLHFGATSPDGRTSQQSGVEGLATQALQARGEPTTHQTLQDLGIAISQDPDLPELTVGPAAPFRQITERHIWLKTRGDHGDPLADRVEAWLLTALTNQIRWNRLNLIAALYSVFAGVLSPEPEFVASCIDSYTQTGSEGDLVLRDEDDPSSRQAEVRLMSELVGSLGVRLGYVAAVEDNGDVLWQDSAQTQYLFRSTATAILGPHLLAPPLSTGQRCLIVPGGRAALIATKLRRDPRLGALAREQNWVFIKYRHVRHMAERIQGRDDIGVFLGLDPIVEQSSAQLSLPL